MYLQDRDERVGFRRQAWAHIQMQLTRQAGRRCGLLARLGADCAPKSIHPIITLTQLNSVNP